MLRSYKSSLLVVPAILLAGLYINTNAFADSNDVDFSVTVIPSLTLALSSNTVNLPITPDVDGEYNSANFTVTSATNNAYGYTLVMGTSNVDLTSNTVNPTTGTNPTIPTLAETQDGISAATFEASTDSNILNHYGAAIGTGNNFNAMKTTNQVKKTNANNASGVDNTVITLASKLDLATVPGTYSTTINFQMTANPLPGGLEEAYQNAGKTKKTIGGKQYYAMQDMNSTICSNATVEDDQLQVYDTRDDKIYWIAKLKDGHCWMTQNLDLDLETTPNHVLALTSENTDLNTYGSNGYDTSNGYSKDANDIITWTPERNTIPTSSISSAGSITGWTNDDNNPYSIDTGDWYWTDTWYASTENNYLAGNVGDPPKFATSPYLGNGTHGHVGNYYNWSAAVASNDASFYTTDSISGSPNNPQNSICPSGWRLPTITKEGNNIKIDYAAIGDYGATSTGYERDITITNAPMHLVRSGRILHDGLNYAGHYGYYATNAVFGSSNIYGLGVSSGFVNPMLDMSKAYGYSVRCIAQ